MEVDVLTHELASARDTIQDLRNKVTEIRMEQVEVRQAVQSLVALPLELKALELRFERFVSKAAGALAVLTVLMTVVLKVWK